MLFVLDSILWSSGRFCLFCFDLAKVWFNLVRFASIVFGVELKHIVFSSILLSLEQILFCFDLARIDTNMVCFCFDPVGDWTSFSLRSCLYQGQLHSFCFDPAKFFVKFVCFASILQSLKLVIFVFSSIQQILD
jgi:hypothetical protein